MYDFTRLVNPNLIPDGAYPQLDFLAEHCNQLVAFTDTRPVAGVDQSNPSLEKISA
jgi:hypothetical protein